MQGLKEVVLFPKIMVKSFGGLLLIPHQGNTNTVIAGGYHRNILRLERGYIMSVEGYEGICAGCFEPIRNGEGFKFREKGKIFHSRCVKNRPNSYYIKLEEVTARFETAS
jgi:hypothetical protein